MSYLQGGGVISPHGKAAQKRYDARAEKFTEDVLWVLRTQGPTPAHMLHPYLRMVPGYSGAVVREAMWILLDRGEIEISEGHMDLRITEKDNVQED